MEKIVNHIQCANLHSRLVIRLYQNYPNLVVSGVAMCTERTNKIDLTIFTAASL